jgi:hypothetical protein
MFAHRGDGPGRRRRRPAAPVPSPPQLGIHHVIPLAADANHFSQFPLVGAPSRGGTIAAMAEYRIVCANSAVTTATHPHVVSVGLDTPGAPGPRLLAVADVVAGIDAGDRFYLRLGETRVAVSKYTCRDCGIKTLRSHVDGRWNNNLDDMSPCPR